MPPKVCWQCFASSFSLVFASFAFLLLLSIFFLFFHSVIAALTSAHARISALEAELKASRQAWEGATAAKVSAEKAVKAAKAKAKKAEEALNDTKQKQLRREWSIAERLNNISAAGGGKYFPHGLFARACLLRVAIYFFRSFLCGAPEKIGEFWRLPQLNAEDPLMASVDLLESNWKFALDVFWLTRHVLVRIFVRFWPKKRGEMPGDNLNKLIETFDTVEDLVLALKRTSVKRGVEGAIALAQSYGEEVN
jgi:hypothetical protein